MIYSKCFTLSYSLRKYLNIHQILFNYSKFRRGSILILVLIFLHLYYNILIRFYSCHKKRLQTLLVQLSKHSKLNIFVSPLAVRHFTVRDGRRSCQRQGLPWTSISGYVITCSSFRPWLLSAAQRFSGSRCVLPECGPQKMQSCFFLP